MRYYLISDNTDTYSGMRMTGIDGVVVSQKQDIKAALDKVLSDDSIGVLLITEKLAALCPEQISTIKLSHSAPLVVEIPDRHGTSRSKDSITKYVREAIGAKF